MSEIYSVRYIQFTLSEFVRLYPEYARMIPPVINFSDSRYIVRIDLDKGAMEFGYAEDPWVIE